MKYKLFFASISIFGLMVFFSNFVKATVTFDSSSSAGDVANSLTWAHTVAPGGALFASVSCFSGGSITGVTYNGAAMTQLWNIDLGTSGVGARSSGWLTVNPATGSSKNIVATASATCDGGIDGGAISFTGVETSSVASAHRSVYTRGTDNGSPSITVADSQSGDVVVSAIGNWGANPVAQQTQRVSQINFFGTDYDHIVETTFAAGSNAIVSYSGGAYYTMGATALAPAAPSAPSAPVISSFSASPPSISQGNSSTLSWSVSGNPTPTLSVTPGNPSTSSGSASVSPTQTTTYTLTATNSQGSAQAQTTITVTAPPPPDTQAPTTPANLSATAVSSSQINLFWSASTDNTAVTGYRIYRGGTQIGTSATNSYSDTGLSPSTAYSYTVSSYDAAGNTSSQSSSVSATTQASAPPPSGNTITAASCSVSAVQSAINTVQDGGTVIVPNGTCSWSSGVNFSNDKGVSLVCATAGSCIINGTTGQMAYLDSLSGVNNKLYRISGFRFQNAPAGSIPIWFYGNGTMSQFRIDHNTFANWGSDSIAIMLGSSDRVGKFYGVIDHNTFSGANNIMGVKIFGPGDPSQLSASVRGTSQNVFIEDNVYDFSTNTNLGSGCMDAWSAPALVFRYNDTKNCLVTAHGVTHGTVINFEFYNNNLRRTANSGGWEDGTRLFHHQGSGEIFAWGNTFYSVGALSGGALAITHYRSASPSVAGYDTSLGRCDGTKPIDGNRNGQLGYPCWMQPGRAPAGGSPVYGTLSPIYAWMNVDSSTGNKVSVAIENPWDAINPSVDDHIKPNRDYYDAVSASAQTSPTSPFNGATGMGFGTLANRPTTCTTNLLEQGGGVGYWATDTQTLYRCSATNIWTVQYKPYVYPHPLVSGATPPPPSDTTPPSAPSGLSATAISSSAINLSWIASTDNVGVTGYRIYRGGVQIGTTITTNYNDNGLTASTLYSYTVSAYDAAGNTSSLSASVSATTPSGIPVPGDFNSDHIVNSLDYSLLNSHWYQTTNISVYDLLADNLINTLDYAILKENWNKTW